MDLFISNIRQLVTVAAGRAGSKRGAAMRDLGVVQDAGVLCRNGRIVWAGPMREWHGGDDVPAFDATGMVVLPGFVDAHTHMMFAGDRASEFGLRCSGATYQEIAAQGGGILHTVREVRAATKKELKQQTARFLGEMLRHGTTTVEIKSGYGLSEDSETKMLEAINELRAEEVTTVVPTFIGAHAVPPEFRERPGAYTDLIVGRMIPYVGRKKLAAFCDVFCEEGYFSVDDSERILREGLRHGMRPKVHADELRPLGGTELAVRVGAVSADHLEHVSPAAITDLASSSVVATLLPGVSFFLNHGYAPARLLIDAGAIVAIASDFNPGSCMSYSMPLMMTIACTQMRMTPEEAIAAGTINGAAALAMGHERGSIEPGKAADLVIADIPDYRHLVYHYGTNHVVRTVKNGTLLEW